jgi:hypothetical protein
VMSDETAQWGQSIRTPAQLNQFVEQERRRVARLQGEEPPAPDVDTE